MAKDSVGAMDVQKPQKPLVFADEHSAQDEFFEKEEVGEVKSFYDASSIPGHAEIVMANEIDKSTVFSTKVKESYYKRFGTGPKDLPADFRWVRSVGPDGRRSYNADVTKMNYLRQGYRPATKEDLKSLGFEMPATAELLADGTIRRMDTDLFIVDGERAKQLEAERDAAAREADTAAGEHDRPDEIWIAEEERRRENPMERLQSQRSAS